MCVCWGGGGITECVKDYILFPSILTSNKSYSLNLIRLCSTDIEDARYLYMHLVSQLFTYKLVVNSDKRANSQGYEGSHAYSFSLLQGIQAGLIFYSELLL